MKWSIVTALVLALVVESWLLSLYIPGLGGAPEREGAPSGPVEARPVKVRVRHSAASPITTELVLTGRTEPSRMATLSAETKGRVIAVEAAKGAHVKAGDVIVRIDPGDRAARLAQARALIGQRKLEYDAGKKLSAKGFQSQTKLAEAKANLRTALAQLKQIELDIARTTIRAPFDGILQDRTVEVGDYLGIGDPAAIVVDLDPVLAVAQVAEREIGGVRPDQPGSARLITGEIVTGRVRYVSAVGETGTRTFRIELEIPNAERRVAAGLTAELRLPLDEALAHLISSAVLTLTDDGAVGVKSVDEGGVVRFHAVGIEADTPEGIWITGLPEELDIITVGQEFVLEGQKVEAVPEGDGTPEWVGDKSPEGES